MRLAIVIALVSAAFAQLHAEDAADKPLRPLAKIAGQLDKGFAAWFRGAEAQVAFSPWRAEADDEAELRKYLKDAGVSRASCMGFDLDLVLTKVDKPAYCLRAFVCANGTRASLMRLKGEAMRTTDAALVKSSTPRCACVDQLSPFGEATDGLLSLLRGTGWKDVPFVSVDELMKGIASKEVKEEASQEVEKGKAVLEQVHGDLEKLGHDGVRVHLRGVTLFGYDWDRRGVGLILCSLAEAEPGKVCLGIEKVKLFEKRPRRWRLFVRTDHGKASPEGASQDSQGRSPWSEAPQQSEALEGRPIRPSPLNGSPRQGFPSPRCACSRAFGPGFLGPPLRGGPSRGQFWRTVSRIQPK